MKTPNRESPTSLFKPMEGVHITADGTDSASRHSGEKGEHDQYNHQTGLTAHDLLSSDPPRKPWQRTRSGVKDCLLWVRSVLEPVAGLEWLCLCMLGAVMALVSFFMDLSVAKLLRAQHWLYSHLEGHRLLQFLSWTVYPVSLCTLSSSFSHSLCPQSAGSGLPEVRTILSGVELPDYLSLTNLFAKLVGLICTLAAGSSVFLGKVGPFVHLSTMMGAYLDRMCVSMRGGKEVTSHRDMLVAAAAVGVGSCFGAPISGVLFSVEVMGTHFVVRDYCRCFFAAACGALTFRTLSVLSGEQETVQALYKTSFSSDLPYHTPEILAFALLGLLCGAVSCLYLFCHRRMLRFTKTNKLISGILATEKALYTGAVVFLLASVTYPHSAGRFMAGELSMKQLLTSLLDSRQWWSLSQNASVRPPQESTPESLWQEWSPSGVSVYHTLAFFLVMKLWMLVLACTLPLPAGYFMPAFIYGAGIGRLTGEVLSYMVQNGFHAEGEIGLVNPGGYALAGAAAFSGAVTHTLSPALLALELTGQSTHAAPVLLATLTANAVARSRLRPSFYDAVSLAKRLPHLPSLLRAQPELSSVRLGQVLSGGGEVLERRGGAAEVRLALAASPQTAFPVVDSHESQLLLGSVSRTELQRFLRRVADGQTEPVSDIQLGDVCLIQPITVQASVHTTVQQAHQIMSLLSAQQLFVTEKGRLCGFMTWKEMKTAIEDLAHGRFE
ncbi:chloride channel K isoform X2 [Anguilla anguilla]|uniref:chloride channel K isoform X2 n=1 Tax=Anguilla anguilla TaxID=7936 RepID=UPI0015ACE1AF|nr:chloride channel K isoform X2 [Anguilla anguilla]